jgi:hypothetical protein
MNKLISEDNSITDRAIASDIRTTSALLIKRELILRRLWATPTIFTTIKCIQLCEVPLAECCSYISPCTVRRSQCKIKGIADLGTYGLAIKGVFSIDGSKRLKETNPARYENMLKLDIPNKKDYYMILDEYLYVMDPDMGAANMIVYIDGDLKMEGENCQCSEISEDFFCENPLDREFKCPAYLIDNVKSIVHDKILKIYRSALPDRTSDEIDTSR